MILRPASSIRPTRVLNPTTPVRRRDGNGYERRFEVIYDKRAPRVPAPHNCLRGLLGHGQMRPCPDASKQDIRCASGGKTVDTTWHIGREHPDVHDALGGSSRSEQLKASLVALAAELRSLRVAGPILIAAELLTKLALPSVVH